MIKECLECGDEFTPERVGTPREQKFCCHPCAMSHNAKNRAPLSDAHKKKLSIALAGREFSSEHKARLSASNRGRPVSRETREKMSRNKWRQPEPWKGLHQPTTSKGGYRLIYKPEHHEAFVSGYTREHRFIVEQEIGRRLSADEIVHHINGDRLDNRLENLQLLTASEHSRLHARQRQKKTTPENLIHLCIVCDGKRHGIPIKESEPQWQARSR